MVTKRAGMSRLAGRGFLLLAVVAIQAACVGWPSPVSDSGLLPHQVGGYCTSWSNAKGIKAPHGVSLVARPMKDKLNGTLLLYVNILVPTAVTVRTEKPEIVLTSPTWPEPRRLRINHFTGRGGSRFPPESALQGFTDPDLPPEVVTLWYLPHADTEFPPTGLPQVPEFTLQLPTLEINGERFQPGPITFRACRR